MDVNDFKDLQKAREERGLCVKCGFFPASKRDGNIHTKLCEACFDATNERIRRLEIEWELMMKEFGGEFYG